MDSESANRERDKRLRKLLLVALHNGKAYGPSGDLDGITLRDVAQSGLPEAQQFEDERHAISLVRDLVHKGLANETHRTLRRGERFGLTHMRVRVTDRGSMLINETLDPDPDIDDERIMEGK